MDLLDDPEFLEWERNQVGEAVAPEYRSRKSKAISHKYNEPLTWFRYLPGPSSPSVSNTVQPMIDLKEDYNISGNPSIDAMIIRFSELESLEGMIL